MKIKYKRFPDRCYAVVVGKRRGPCGHDMKTARARYRRSGLIASARSDCPRHLLRARRDG